MPPSQRQVLSNNKTVATAILGARVKCFMDPGSRETANEGGR